MNTDNRQRRWRRVAIQLIALAAVLAAHGWARIQSAQDIGYDRRHMYSGDYQVALAIMSGRGFELLRRDRPAPEAIRDFTARKRVRLDAADLAAFDAAARMYPPDEPGLHSANSAHWSFTDGVFDGQGNEFSRVFELYVAAGLWSVFGTDWRVHTTFYIGLSVLCGLLVFLIAKRVSGSFGCGLLAAAIFALSPYETEYAIVSIRDVNPLWFTIIAYFVVTCVADRFKPAWANGLSYFATGVASTIGLGWRPDASMLLPVILATMVAVLIWNRRRWRWIGLAILLFLAGAKTPMLLIGQLLPDDAPARGMFQFLHVSHYSDCVRSVLLEQEDSFQTLRSDNFVYTLACEYHEHDPVDAREDWGRSLWGPAYSNLMVRVFRDMAQYHLYDWAIALPGVYFRALVDAAGHHGDHFAKFQWWLPWAALLGGLPGLFVYRARSPIVLSLFGFTVFYAGVFLVVSPEDGHLAPFVCPLILLGALGLWMPIRLFAMRGKAPDFEPPFRLRRRWVVTTAVTVVVVLTGTLFAAYRLAQAKRQEYLAAVIACEPTGIDVHEQIADPRVFATMVDFGPDEQRGYLLDIVAGDRSGDLVLRVVPEEERGAFAFETRHTLVPGTRQRFFWSCYRGWRHYGNARSRYTVRLTGDAEIVGARQLDLGPWHRLPFATVFTDDDSHAGSPGLATASAVQFIDRAGPRNAWGLSFTEALVTSLGPPSRVIAGRDDPVCRVEVVSGSQSRVDDEGTWITTTPDPSRYTAVFGAFTAPERGRYMFRLDTRIEAGIFALGLLSGDHSQWMPLAGTIDDIVSGGEARLVLCDLDAGESVVPTLSNTMHEGVSEYLVRGLEIRRLVPEAPSQ